MPSADRSDLFPGALEMMILQTLRRGPRHGYELAQAIRRASDELVHVEEGSLYPALQRMRQKRWITAEWRQTPNNQRARYYTITRAGRAALGEQEAGFGALIAAIQQVLRST